MQRGVLRPRRHLSENDYYVANSEVCWLGVEAFLIA